MIYDRTQGDIESALSLRMKKVQTFQELSEAEIEILERGFLTINTLNRIESKQDELKNLFNEIGYWNTPISTRQWAYTDIFKGTQFDRILYNLDVLTEAFFTYRDTPNIPDNNYRKYQTINDVEKILYDLDIMINDVKSHYRECGTFECGEE